MGESANSRRLTTKMMPATSVICTPEIVMMWKMPASRMRSLGVVGEKVAFARDHRRRDRALVAADDRVDPERQTVARLVDRGVEALPPSGVARRRQVLDRPERRADRADAGEKRVAGEVVSARQRRSRGRQQARLELDIVAGRDVGRVAGRDP